jgi:hypothetical protein
MKISVNIYVDSDNDIDLIKKELFYQPNQCIPSPGLQMIRVEDIYAAVIEIMNEVFIDDSKLDVKIKPQILMDELKEKAKAILDKHHIPW